MNEELEKAKADMIADLGFEKKSKQAKNVDERKLVFKDNVKTYEFVLNLQKTLKGESSKELTEDEIAMRNQVYRRVFLKMDELGLLKKEEPDEKLLNYSSWNQTDSEEAFIRQQLYSKMTILAEEHWNQFT